MTEYNNITNKQKLARYLLIARLMEFELSKQPLPEWFQRNMEVAYDAMIGIIAPLEANVKEDLKDNRNPHAAADDRVRYIVNNINHPSVRCFIIGELIDLEKKEEGILETEKERLENAGKFIGAIVSASLNNPRCKKFMQDSSKNIILDSFENIKDVAMDVRAFVNMLVEHGIPRE